MSDKQQQPAAEGRRVVFFDLDGTLHQEDMFGSFLRFLLRRLPLNLLLVIPVLPPIGLALLLQLYRRRHTLNIDTVSEMRG